MRYLTKIDDGGYVLVEATTPEAAVAAAEIRYQRGATLVPLAGGIFVPQGAEQPLRSIVTERARINAQQAKVQAQIAELQETMTRLDAEHRELNKQQTNVAQAVAQGSVQGTREVYTGNGDD